MSKPKAPPPPDMSGVAAANSQAAEYAFQTSREQLAWAKEQYADQAQTTNRVIDAMLKTQDEASAYATEDRDRYTSVFQPLEDQFVKRANELQNPQLLEQDAARAAGDVSQQFEIARNNARQNLEKFGVDPSQTRAAALDLGTRTAEAAARAGAANAARQAGQQRGDAVLGAAVNLGKGYPAQVAQQQGISTGAGQGAVSSGNQTFSTGANAMGTPVQYQGAGFQGLSGWSNALTSGYGMQMERYKANQSASSGLGSLLGMGLGIGTKLATGGLFEEGGSVPSKDEFEHAMQGPSQTGIRITQEMSPSGGIQTDDVEAVSSEGSPLRLNVNEFVIPDDTVLWYGEKHLQRLIEKGREERQGATAKPALAAIDTRGERPQGIRTGG